MTKIFSFSLILIILCSCNRETPNIEEEMEVVDHSYDEIKTRRISWSQIFAQKEQDYLCYFFSETCVHCQELKNEIIEFSFVSILPFFFVKESPDFVFKENIGDTIGITTVDVFFIKGTPSLIEIKNGKINKNIAGNTKIRDYIS